MRVMARSSVALFVALLVVASPVVWAQEDDVDESQVLVLTDANYTETLEKHDYVMKLKPEYAGAAKDLESYEPKVVLAKLDADSEKKVASENEIKGYPTIFWFEKGTKIEYPGNRRRADIVRWIKKRTGPPTSDLADVAALDANKPENDAMLVAVLDALEGAEFEAFQEAAKKHEDVTMLTTTSAEVAEALGVAKAKRPVYVVRRAFGESAPEDVSSEGHAAFEGKSLDEQLVSLLKAERLPAYIEFSTETSAAIFGSGVDRQLIVAAGSEALAPGSDLDKLLREASPKLRGRFVVVTARLGADQAKAVVEFFGLAEDPEAAPQVVGFHATETGKYRFPFDELTLDNLLAFAKQVEDGSAPRLLKSAAEPAAHTEEGLTTVVGSTFEKLVLDSEKDVLLEVHAPWCGHCKKLEPIYKKLAKRFETVDSITIAQMDGTGNEHPAAEFRSFPTLLWYPAGKDQKAVPYSGERTVSAFVKFLKKNASKDFKLPKKSKKGKAKKEADADAEEIIQLVALVDVLNALCGIVGGSAFLGFLFWLARLNITYGVLAAAPEVMRGVVGAKLFCKSLRRTEAWLIYKALPTLRKRPDLSVSIPGLFSISYYQFSYVLLILYPFVFIYVFYALLANRRRALRKEAAGGSDARGKGKTKSSAKPPARPRTRKDE
ncbi:hypothetical protein H632_c453p0 [Helicosporidium sp. ATCC 50920]|nr:hypothetical protein H632_c453p0 [Helicosporidium sp. ATCC 50920]|eukprot:KDD75888.1 hypothetical protein H632_c453p0 [Helicosporidium sp. ATCC 50920]